jgi:hypothetical protein
MRLEILEINCVTRPIKMFKNVKRRKQECMNQDVGYVVIHVSVRRR